MLGQVPQDVSGLSLTYIREGCFRFEMRPDQDHLSRRWFVFQLEKGKDLEGYGVEGIAVGIGARAYIIPDTTFERIDTVITMNFVEHLSFVTEKNTVGTFEIVGIVLEMEAGRIQFRRTEACVSSNKVT